MENVLKNVVLDFMPSEEFVLLVINHAKHVPTTQLNVLLVLITTSVPTEDVFNHAAKELIWTAFQRHADHVHQLVPHAAHNKLVSHAKTAR